MVWKTDNATGGFSAGKPWLPVTAPHLPLSVAAQAGDPASMLAHYRAALAFRRAHPVLRFGGMTLPEARGDLATFLRVGEETLFCAFNLGSGSVSLDLPQGNWVPVGGEIGAEMAAEAVDGAGARLGPWGYSLMQRQ
jgi:alpha-glucosidase